MNDLVFLWEVLVQILIAFFVLTVFSLIGYLVFIFFRWIGFRINE